MLSRLSEYMFSLLIIITLVKNINAVNGDKYNISLVNIDPTKYSLKDGQLKADENFMGYINVIHTLLSYKYKKFIN